jgi:CBS domain containing-hemolysin-like protein/mannitol/fructose-specific phosphotransferase system IIA component (Ntr-type)
MVTALFLLAVVFFLVMNGFFSLGEFAAVKIRPTRVQQLAEGGDARGVALAHIKSRLDEYLSVCQVGITLSSIGLGFLGEPAIARLIQRGLDDSLSPAVAHGIALGLTYLFVTYVSIVLAELVPKTIALRATERAALFTARPMRLCYRLFYVPLVVLNRSANGLLRVFGLRPSSEGDRLTEEELRLALAESQKGGELSFRQLLTIENVFISGKLKTADVMKPRAQAHALRLDVPWEENDRMLHESKYSRFPLLEKSDGPPLGIIHVKDVFYSRRHALNESELRLMARASATVKEDQPLQEVLSELQRRHVHWAFVVDAQGRWTGFITLEDVMEEVIGAVEDEFEIDPPLHLADVLTPGRIVLGLTAGSLEEAIRKAFASVPAAELPCPADKLASAVVERERTMPTYLGRGLAVPHARLEGLEKPALLLARSDEGIPVVGRSERAHLLFIVLTSTQSPRDQARLLARVGGLLDSEAVERQLREGKSVGDVLEAVRAGELAVLA